MTCNANHPIYSTSLCELPDGHDGPHSTLVRGGKFSTRHTWPLVTIKNAPPENFYNRLERRGWRWVGGNSRYDFYKKMGWMVTVPNTIDAPTRFNRLHAVPGKSLVMRASRAAGETRPLDAAENDERREESEYSHSDGAHQ